MIIKIFTGPLNYDILSLYEIEDQEFIIGVDQGAYFLAENKISFDLAIGDFDSVNKEEFELIKSFTKDIMKFDKVKDYTDTFLAVKEALKKDYSEIMIYGGIGHRFDHSYANLNLLKLGNISIVTDELAMYMLDPGDYNIKNTHSYISFFAIEDVIDLHLKGFLYETDIDYLDTENPLCISNEKEGSVSFKEGLLLVIHQNESK